MADPVSNNCAVSSLINTKDENEKYLRDKEKIFYYMLGSILSSVALIILSIIHPFKVDKGYSNNP
ncbi:MAG: hypothetical protein Q7S33_01130 [Nanoarchaeota archaeon]|nr:hypothetical protein [Nanoarchaeota archaeon]